MSVFSLGRSAPPPCQADVSLPPSLSPSLPVPLSLPLPPSPPPLCPRVPTRRCSPSRRAASEEGARIAAGASVPLSESSLTVSCLLSLSPPLKGRSSAPPRRAVRGGLCGGRADIASRGPRRVTAGRLHVRGGFVLVGGAGLAGAAGGGAELLLALLDRVGARLPRRTHTHTHMFSPSPPPSLSLSRMHACTHPRTHAHTQRRARRRRMSSRVRQRGIYIYIYI